MICFKHFFGSVIGTEFLIDIDHVGIELQRTFG